MTPNDWMNDLNDLAASLGVELPHTTYNGTEHQSDRGLTHDPTSNPFTQSYQSLETHHPLSPLDHLSSHHAPVRLESEPQTVSSDTPVWPNPTPLTPDLFQPHHQYNPHPTDPSLIIGHPQPEMTHWHLQEHPDSCAIAAQQFAIEDITHHSFSESQLRIEAIANGWYQPGLGTPMEDFGKLLATEAHVPVETHTGATIADLTHKLAQGEEVFVGVNSQVEWLPDKHSLLGQIAPTLVDPSHFAGQPADHIVQVIGEKINPLDPFHPTIIVNDSGSPHGRGVEIPAEQFQQAMDASQGYMASTNIHGNMTSDRGLTNPLTQEQTYFGCEVSSSDNSHTVWIDGSKYGTYNGNTFYWNNDKLAGHWDCAKHHAYTQNGADLGYAKTWNDAALLIYKRDY